MTEKFEQSLEEQMASLENLPKIQEQSEQIMSDLEQEMDPQFFAVLRRIEILATTGQITQVQAKQARQKLEQARLNFEKKTYEDRFLEWAVDDKQIKFVVEKDNYKLKSTIKSELGTFFESVVPLPDETFLAFGSNHIYRCEGKIREKVRDLEEFSIHLYQPSPDTIFAVGSKNIRKIDNSEDSFDDEFWSFAELAKVESFYTSSSYLRNGNEMIVGFGEGSVYSIDLSDPNIAPQPIFQSDGNGSLNPITAIDCFENTIFVGEGQSVYVGQGQDMKTIKAYHQGENGIETEDIFALNAEISAIQAVNNNEIIIGTRRGSVIRIYKNEYAWNSQIIGTGKRVYDLQILPDGRVVTAHAIDEEDGSHGSIIAWEKNNQNSWIGKNLFRVEGGSAKRVKVYENGQIFVFSNKGHGEIYDGEVIDA